MINSDDTIVAVSTSVGEGGIGIVRLSGPDALDIADRIFSARDGKRPSGFGTYTVHYGHIIEAPSTKCQVPRVVDEVLMTVMRSPKSYTKEDVVEINCHGGIQAVKKVLDLVVKCGARIAQPGEFTRRAFLNGRIDLTQAEAVLDTIKAKTEGSLKVAMSQLEGGLSKEVASIREAVVDVASQVEASIDFPDEGLEIKDRKNLAVVSRKIIKDLGILSASFNEGAVLREGVLAIICGKPNVGKSSLMNLLLKRDRVIVSPIPGTTRDAVEEMINLKGIPVRLVDTAGIRKAKDALDREGVARSKKYLGMADMALLMFDASAGIDKKDLEIISLLRDKKKLVIINKCDLPKKIDAKKIKKMFKGVGIIEISVEKKRGIELLEKAVVDLVWGGRYIQGEGAIVTSARHKELLDKTLANMLSVKKGLAKNSAPELVAIDLKEAVFNLGLIIGKSVSDDILDRIFERFCIGK